MQKTEIVDETREVVEESSGNVFADLGLPDAEEVLVKAKLLVSIHRIIRERRLTQTKAAKLLGVEQPDISNLMNGRIRGFSSDRLMRFLAALSQDVQITIKPVQARGRKRPRGKISVVTL